MILNNGMYYVQWYVFYVQIQGIQQPQTHTHTQYEAFGYKLFYVSIYIYIFVSRESHHLPLVTESRIVAPGSA